jgi:tetratricopeptide (TPR) repeat protein
MALWLGLMQLPAYCMPDLLANAERLYAAGEFDLAREHVLQELALHPANAGAHYLLGNLYLQEGDKSHAVKQYAAAYELAPTSNAGKFSIIALKRLAPASASDNADGKPDTRAYDPLQPVDKAPKAVNQANSVSSAGQEDNARKESLAKINTAASLESPDSVADSSNHELSLECDRRIKELLERQKKAIAQLRVELNDQVDQLDGGFRSRTGNIADTADNRLAVADYKRKRKLVEDDTAKRCDEIRAFFRAKEDAMRESATAVDEGYSAKNKAVRLVPLGTNIYTRSYQTLSEPATGVIPLQATPSKPISIR